MAKPLSSPKVELAVKVEVVALRAEVQELRQTVVEQAARLQRLEQLFSTFSERGHCSEQFPCPRDTTQKAAVERRKARAAEGGGD